MPQANVAALMSALGGKRTLRLNRGLLSLGPDPDQLGSVWQGVNRSVNEDDQQ